VARAPLAKVTKEEAALLASAPAKMPFEGSFATQPSFRLAPSGDEHLKRDSLEDFFFASDVTPDEADELVVRLGSDRSLAFLLMRRGVLLLTFLATGEKNELIVSSSEVSLKFDSVLMAEGAEAKKMTEMRVVAQPDGDLLFEVSFEERHTALAIPYDHSEAKWTFVLKRLK
jgi:hypothetical protein